MVYAAMDIIEIIHRDLTERTWKDPRAGYFKGPEKEEKSWKETEEVIVQEEESGEHIRRSEQRVGGRQKEKRAMGEQLRSCC